MFDLLLFLPNYKTVYYLKGNSRWKKHMTLIYNSYYFPQLLSCRNDLLAPDSLVKSHPILKIKVPFMIPILIDLYQLHEPKLPDLFININTTLCSHSRILVSTVLRC